MIDFLAITLDDLRRWLIENGQPPYQAESIFSWIYAKGARDWAELSSLSGPLREELSRAFRLSVLEPRRQRSGECGVQKFLWQLIDKSYVDSVLFPAQRGWQLTVSTQVGCPAGCTFCASGRRGFIRNLQPAEIVDQFLQARRWVQQAGGKDITHVSFDGMGEPFKNTKSVFAAIEALCDAQRGNYSIKKVTLSTVGMLEGLDRLLQSQMMVNLVVGLHAPNQALRQKLVPYAKKNHLPELLTLCRRYSQQTGIPVTFDYVLLAGVNDHPDQALELAHLVKNLRCQIRVIPYHGVSGYQWKTPSKKAVKAFRSVLFGSKVVNKAFEGKGLDIAAGLGQLGVIAK